MWVELQENLITDLWQNNLWLFGIVEEKSQKVIWFGVCVGVSFFMQPKSSMWLYSIMIQPKGPWKSLLDQAGGEF